MKSLRIPLYIVLGIFVATFILGSFVDLQLSESIFSANNTFGIIMSTIGTIPGYMMFAFLGGGCIALALTRGYKTPYKVILFICAVAGLGLSTYFSGREFFGPNGFNTGKVWIGYLIALPIMCGVEFLGYYLMKKSNRPYLWLVLAIIAVAMFFALVPGVTLLKNIFHRPRFRSIVGVNDERLYFHSWWERCKNYKFLMSELNLSKEEFKSFPSGHAGASLCSILFAMLLPYIDEKYEKISLPLFCSGVAWSILICFTRILVGAHFLSDVSMGAILTAVFALIANEVLINLKILHHNGEVITREEIINE